MAEVIKPELFDFLDDYLHLLDCGEAIVDDVVPATSPLILFTEAAFAQFFENEVKVEIKGFDEKAQRLAARARSANKDLSPQAKRMITVFRKFCEDYDDVKSASYGGQGTVLEEFHSTLVVRLVTRIRDLAKLNEETELEERAIATLAYLKDVLSLYEWTDHNREDREDE
jgi:hypothetical protein